MSSSSGRDKSTRRNATVTISAPEAATAARNTELAIEVAQCQRLVKGYSDTHERGLRNYDTVMAALRRAGDALAPATLRELRNAALADVHGHQLQAALVRHALA